PGAWGSWASPGDGSGCRSAGNPESIRRACRMSSGSAPIPISRSASARGPSRKGTRLSPRSGPGRAPNSRAGCASTIASWNRPMVRRDSPIGRGRSGSPEGRPAMPYGWGRVPYAYADRLPWMNLPFPIEEYRERLRRLGPRMARDGLDCLVVLGNPADGTNIRYLTNFEDFYGGDSQLVPT